MEKLQVLPEEGIRVFLYKCFSTREKYGVKRTKRKRAFGSRRASRANREEAFVVETPCICRDAMHGVSTEKAFPHVWYPYNYKPLLRDGA